MGTDRPAVLTRTASPPSQTPAAAKCATSIGTDRRGAAVTAAWPESAEIVIAASAHDSATGTTSR